MYIPVNICKSFNVYIFYIYVFMYLCFYVFMYNMSLWLYDGWMEWVYVEWVYWTDMYLVLLIGFKIREHLRFWQINVMFFVFALSVEFFRLGGLFLGPSHPFLRMKPENLPASDVVLWSVIGCSKLVGFSWLPFDNQAWQLEILYKWLNDV